MTLSPIAQTANLLLIYIASTPAYSSDYGPDTLYYSYLHCIHPEESAACPHCTQCETVHHFLLQCPKYTRQRNYLRMAVGFDNMTLHALLTKRDLLKYLIHYVKSTRRLATVFPYVPPVPDSDDENAAQA